MKFRIIRILFVLTASVYFISCARDVSVTPPEKPAPEGFCFINSIPAGAEIFVNNRPTGRFTPDSLRYISGGEYLVRLELPNFRDTVFNLYVSENKINTITINYAANPKMLGSILCKSNPDHALITVNGQPTKNHTPFTLTDLLPGTYTVGFSSFGCRSDSQKVVVKSSLQSVASAALEDTTIWITFNKSNSGIPSDYLTCVEADNNGVVWVGTIDRGLAAFDGQEWKIYNTSNSPLPSNNITSLSIINFSPNSRRIYIGTPEGLEVFTMNNFVITANYQFNQTNSSLPDNYITALAVEPDEYVWIGTPKGMALIPRDLSNPARMEIFTDLPLGEKNIVCISAVPEVYFGRHEVWVGLGNDNGIASFDYSTKAWTNVSPPPNKKVRSLASISGSKVWAGCLGGLETYNNGWTFYQLGSPGNIIESITLTSDAGWACTSEGLFSVTFSGGITAYNTGNSRIASNSLKDIAFDQAGNAWIATAYDGLSLFKRKKL